ncbi:hypothetical protein BLFGPEAP_02194 [Candidatus Methanoperedenaceae archaeon GB50]|nr:hypothetical protein BLFGPEAP_02194 [Candidatus Methanoperedenaceae archaeon GB50]
MGKIEEALEKAKKMREKKEENPFARDSFISNIHSDKSYPHRPFKFRKK